MSTGEPSATSTRRTIVAVFLAGVSVFLVLYETQGLLPAIRGAYDIDAPTASLTVSATNVAMAVFLIPFSVLAPRIGHARQIAGGVVLAALLALILPFMPSPELLIAVRFLQGVAIASVPATAMAYLSLRLPAKALPGAIGVYIAGNTIGGLSSRLLTGLAAEGLGWHGGLAFTAAVSLVFGLIVVWLLRHDLFTTSRVIAARESSTTAPEPAATEQESTSDAESSAAADTAQPPRRAIIPLRSGLWRIYLTGFLCMIVFGGSFTMLGTRLQHDPWRLSEGAVALFFLIYLVGTVVTTYYGRLATKLSRTSLTLIGMVTALVGAGLTLVDDLTGDHHRHVPAHRRLLPRPHGRIRGSQRLTARCRLHPIGGHLPHRLLSGHQPGRLAVGGSVHRFRVAGRGRHVHDLVVRRSHLDVDRGFDRVQETQLIIRSA